MCGLRPADIEKPQLDKLVAAKRQGEAALRNSGLGYTVVRPGPLMEEAGGYKALVFDQGEMPGRLRNKHHAWQPPA